MVERDRSYLDPADPAETVTADLIKAENRTFGRRFLIRSYRWLNKDEI